MIVKNFNKENNWMVERLKQIENRELNEILTLCKEESIFFDKENRLLSISEILDSKEDLMLEMDVVPIIDIYNNDFIVFDIEHNQFAIMNIVDDIIWKRLDSISEYIEKLKQYYENI